MDKSVNSHIKDGNRIVEWVWYGGTDAVGEGVALFFDTDYGTATEADGRRGNRVEKPVASYSNLNFAGVAARDYSAKAGGQFIEINCPGSRGVKVQLNSGVTATINTATLAPIATTGLWGASTEEGRGAAKPRQTVTAGKKVMADLLVGDITWA